MRRIKRKVHIYVIHPDIHNAEEWCAALWPGRMDELDFELIWDAENPQFLIVTELIYTDPKIRRKFASMYHEDMVTIFMAGESIYPDLNLFDYAFCFDDSAGEGRVTSYVHRNFYREYITKKKNDFEHNNALAKEALLRKNGFCNFIYSNPNGHKNREKIFHVLNTYKKVDSLGAFLNNTGYSDENLWSMQERVRNSLSLKSNYKFTIAFENATCRGYTSEKIFTSLEAHTIPIYWGNPEIGKIVNEKAIINCHIYENFEQVLDRVKEIDGDDRIWCDMICEPWLTQKQELEEQEREEKYYHFLEDIFLQDHRNGGVKRGLGTYADIYKNFFFGNTEQYERANANWALCIKWIQVLHHGKSIADFVKERNAKTIAVYGMGALGISTYEELEKHKNIEVYGLDRGHPVIPARMKCMCPYEVNEDLQPDLVIITVMWDIGVIAEEMGRLFGCDVYGILEIIEKLLSTEAVGGK